MGLWSCSYLAFNWLAARFEAVAKCWLAGICLVYWGAKGCGRKDGGRSVGLRVFWKGWNQSSRLATAAPAIESASCEDFRADVWPMLAPPCSVRRRSATLPLALDHVRGGRVHKLYAAAPPLSRHYSLTYADRQHSSNGRRAPFGHHHGYHSHHHGVGAGHRGPGLEGEPFGHRWGAQAGFPVGACSWCSASERASPAWSCCRW